MMGGGVYVRRGGSFIMEGGTIVENTTAEYGGGIAYEFLQLFFEFHFLKHIQNLLYIFVQYIRRKKKRQWKP